MSHQDFNTNGWAVTRDQAGDPSKFSATKPGHTLTIRRNEIAAGERTLADWRIVWNGYDVGRSRTAPEAIRKAYDFMRKK